MALTPYTSSSFPFAADYYGAANYFPQYNGGYFGGATQQQQQQQPYGFYGSGQAAYSYPTYNFGSYNYNPYAQPAAAAQTYGSPAANFNIPFGGYTPATYNPYASQYAYPTFAHHQPNVSDFEYNPSGTHVFGMHAMDLQAPTASMPYQGPSDHQWPAAIQYSTHVHPIRRQAPTIKRGVRGLGLIDSWRGEPKY